MDLSTEKLQSAFKNLTGKGRISESNISDAIREVRLALLEADVNYGIVKEFIKRVKEKALGQQVLDSVTPGQQFVEILHSELVALMGGGEAHVALEAGPYGMPTLMLCGLQGAGKTTHAVKLAKYFKGKRALIIAADLQRPAAILQLKTLAKQIDVPVFSVEGEMDPTRVVKQGMEHAKAQGHDLVILDTAGRLHVDDALMQELAQIKKIAVPSEVLFVANATLGQDAVTTAKAFHEQIGVTGTILTMLDGDTRAGAAISVRAVTGQPLKFEGIGEKLDDFQLFNARSMADRILGMGDTINLVKKAKEHFDASKEEELKEKFKKASFTFEDYLTQMESFKKMGPIKKLLGMIPGMAGKMDLLDSSEEKFKTVEAIIRSMTRQERKMDKLGMSRRRRLAKGSGVAIDEVNRLIKSFDQAKKFMKNMSGMKNMDALKQFTGGQT